MRILAAIICGILFGAFLAALGAASFLTGGRASEVFATIWHVLVTYVGGGALLGVIVGVLHPLVRGRISAAALGAVALVPLVALVGQAQFGPVSRWSESDALIVVLVGVTFGSALGFGLYPKVMEHFAWMSEQSD